jgi:hypothetical protein
MQIKIYQVNRAHARELGFMSHEWATKHTGSPDIDRDAYDMVWAGELDHEAGLEEIYEIFNLRHPADFRGHSLSMSDIVELPDGLHFCDSFGWKSVEWKDHTRKEETR